MSISQPLICYQCWPLKRNHYDSCDHAIALRDAARAEQQEVVEAAQRLRAELSTWHLDRVRDGNTWGATNLAVLEQRLAEFDAALRSQR